MQSSSSAHNLSWSAHRREYYKSLSTSQLAIIGSQKEACRTLQVVPMELLSSFFSRFLLEFGRLPGVLIWPYVTPWMIVATTTDNTRPVDISVYKKIDCVLLWVDSGPSCRTAPSKTLAPQTAMWSGSMQTTRKGGNGKTKRWHTHKFATRETPIPHGLHLLLPQK